MSPAPAPDPRHVFVTGATGYLGRALAQKLVARGHRVRALTRRRPDPPLPPAVEIVTGDALDADTFTPYVAPCDTLVHLVGTPHPAPWKASSFASVDLPSILAAVAAAKSAGVRHLVYVSVAQPAPVMRAFIAVRQAGESAIAASGIDATVLRPWYVVGPGHWWPLALVPLYAALERLASTAPAARRLGLVRHAQMQAALVAAVETPAVGLRIVDVPAIRAAGLASSSGP